MGRRDSTDERWKALKEKITKRDKSTCRLMRVLTAQEYLLLRKKAPSKLLERLDHAHCFGVGPHPHMCYNEKNVVLLNRFSHENLDNCRNPITSEPISREERDNWWKRIIGESIYNELEEVSYRYKEETENG